MAEADILVYNGDSIRREVLSSEECPEGNHFEVHELEDDFSGETKYCTSFGNYEEALSEYNKVAYIEGKPARLLEVDAERKRKKSGRRNSISRCLKCTEITYSEN